MRILTLLLLFITFFFAAEIRIATFNVENLFDGKNHGTEYRDFEISRNSNWNNERYQKKSKAISNLIKELNADIISLQEIENKCVIKRLAKVSACLPAPKGNDSL